MLRLLVAVLALCGLGLSLFRLESARMGIEMSELRVGETPVTLYRATADPAPLVVIAHGFAGSRQLMEAFSLSFAHAGYVVAAFDFEGHGRNPVPMSGDVTSIDGTTALLVDETLRVLDQALSLPNVADQAILLGHSMASDVVIRAGLRDPRVQATIAVSMYSEAVTAQAPANLLILSGAFEVHLRNVALQALRSLSPDAEEGQTLREDDLVRRAAVAPRVGHLGVLYSPTSLREALDWADTATGRSAPGGVIVVGPWIALLLGSIVAFAWPLAVLLPRRRDPGAILGWRQVALVALLPALVAPLIAVWIPLNLLPVLVADYLGLHLLIYGALQLALLAWLGHRLGYVDPPTVALTLAWGIGAFGLALDRYGASFLPTGDRIWIVALLALGTVPFMLADSLATRAGRLPLLRRFALRLSLFASLALAVALDPERLMFLVIVFPVMVLFFVVYGLMGRWFGQRGGAAGAGLALGLILAWSLGASFPMFAA